MSKRLVLFSQPSLEVFDKLKSALFPVFFKNRVFAYMPTEGDNVEANEKYTPIWQDYVEKNNARFVFVDNSKRDKEAKTEAEKIRSANILMITGGNTFKLLNNLKKSGLDKIIIKFWQKENVVLAGFSAGAIVLSPTIGVANYGDPNDIGITDLKGLNIIDFEVWPHYESTQNAEVTEYEIKNKYQLKTISNEEVIIIDK